METSNLSLAERFRKLSGIKKRGRNEHGDFYRVKHVLKILNAEGSMNQRELADRLDIRPQSLGELLGKMERDGTIQRHCNPNDKRQRLLTVGPEGRRILERGGQERSRQIDLFYNCLTAEEKNTLAALLDKLIAANMEGSTENATDENRCK